MLRHGSSPGKRPGFSNNIAKLTSTPVSYTHLDVYKRQALSWLWKGAAVHFLVASDPVKKHGPWVVANLRVVTSLGDPV